MVATGAVFSNTAPAEPASFGLLSPAATVVIDNDPHWTSGFDYETLDCAADVTLRDICNTGVSVSGVEPEGSELWRNYQPFAIETGFKCSTMSRSPEEVERITTDRATACIQKALEHEFWSGALAKAAAEEYPEDRGEYPNRYLASTGAADVTPTPGTAVKTKHGLALLEGALARCGCGIKGTIHVTREVGSALAPKNENGTLQTPLGNTVIAGPGYDGTGPNGSQPTGAQVWMYATGPVTVRLSDITTVQDERSQAVNIKNNEIFYLVDAVGAVTWNSCCHYAVLVDLSLDYA